VTYVKCFKFLEKFIKELIEAVPHAEYRRRRNYGLKEVISYCKNRKYTNLILIMEKDSNPFALILIHLPDGPTAYFKLSSIKLRKHIRNAGKPTSHNPEVILNNFNTRLGHTIGRMLASLFDQNPEFRGRRVCTFHNQRDFIFFRHHRYIFDNLTEKTFEHAKAKLQELGPRFTLRLKKLQHGCLDTARGEYEWVHKVNLLCHSVCTYIAV